MAVLTFAHRFPFLVIFLVIACALCAACVVPPGPTAATPPVTMQVAATEEVATAPASASPTTGAPPATQRPAAEEATLVVLSSLAPATFDPAVAYYPFETEIVQNVYETLIFFDREHPDRFIPQLALELPTQANGRISADGRTYRFRVRSGVHFHDGAPLTAGDVAYFFQRGLLQGGTDSPQWLFYEAFFGPGVGDITDLVESSGALRDNPVALRDAAAGARLAACERVQQAVSVKGDEVIFHLTQPWSPFLATLAQPWGSVVSRDWVQAQGGWDGDCRTWQSYYRAAQGAGFGLNLAANGTGPYRLASWQPEKALTLSANPGYWRTVPAWPGGPTGAPRFATINYRFIEDGDQRLALLRTGQGDLTSLGSDYDPALDALSGELCSADGACMPRDPALPLRAYTGLPRYRNDALLFNFALDPVGSADYAGSGQLDGQGVPPDFFADVHVRRAFAYCFDVDAYNAAAYASTHVPVYQLIPPGMLGPDEHTPHYTFDLERCRAELTAVRLRSADGRGVLETGFHVAFAYSEDAPTVLSAAAENLQRNFAAISPGLVVEPLPIDAGTYADARRAGFLPFSLVSWEEDLHDPYNWVVPFTTGTYTARQNLPAELQTEFRTRTVPAVAELDPLKRAALYAAVNTHYYETVPGLPLTLYTYRYYLPRRVGGFFYNPAWARYYFYPLYPDAEEQ